MLGSKAVALKPQSASNLTIMVIFTVISAYSQNPPITEGRHKIAGGPIYDLLSIQSMLEDETKLIAWTGKCRKDLMKLFDGDLAEVVDLIQRLKSHDYIDSEWCDNGHGFIAACDAYRVRRDEERKDTGERLTVEYFLKFGISKTGAVLLVVSCHLS
jgi:hypothetical protein